ncbi:TraR/DksA C4-type zinc finger protein [Desulforudis sp. 1088]|uniref:TraR/DksA C4-type zinc finger protein n=1 Tax=unclassified Candidatus Desulforudis TaxID=2635950 RepID=UPI00347379A5
MEQVQLQHFKKRLLDEKAELVERIQSIRSTMTAALEDTIGELSFYDNHPADIGSETFERSKDLSLEENARLTIRAINDALQHMDNGTYGVCENCGREIPPERLEAVPYTTMCQDCKLAREQEGVRRARPVEEEVIQYPYAPSFDGSFEYDREDTWQDVAQHGLSTEIEEVEGEDRSAVVDVDAIPYTIEDGMLYEDNRLDDRIPEGTGG